MQVKTKSFLKELEWSSRFIDKSNKAIPVLQTVKMMAIGTYLYMGATDLECSGQNYVRALSGDTFTVAINPKQLIKYLKSVKDSVLSLEVNGKDLVVKHGENDGLRIEGIAVEDFPALPHVRKTDALGGLAEALPKVLISICGEESRFCLNGALLDTKGNRSVFVSTDGHRLSVADILTTLTDTQVIVPKLALSELSRIAKPDTLVWFGAKGDFVAFRVGNRTITSKRVLGQFPDYGRVMPNQKDMSSVELPVKPLQETIKRVSMAADERVQAVRWNIEHAVLTLSAETTDKGKASGALPLSTNGVTWESGFRAAYILDALKHIGESCRFSFRANEKAPTAVQLSAPGFTYVVMPVRL